MGVSTRLSAGSPSSWTALDQDDIEAFTAKDDMDGLHKALKATYEASARCGGAAPLPASFDARGAGFSRTTVHKLEHDIEQLEHLIAHGGAGTPDAQWLQSEVLPAFREMLHHALLANDPGGFYWFDFAPAHVTQALRPFYNRGLHVPEGAPLAEYLGAGLADPAVVERQYLESTPRVAVVDDFLSPEALAEVRSLLMDSTVWHEAKAADRIGGYVGAYLTDGLFAKAVLRIGSELRARLPGIFKENPLRFLWAYKYDHRYTGVNIHGDDAAVNVNIWVTPDDANLDKSCGGLVIYKTRPPAEWTAEEYGAAERTGFEQLLGSSEWDNVTVPYRANRMVMFDSTLLHKTDRFKFKAGYENRRMNLTLLFGERPH